VHVPARAAGAAATRAHDPKAQDAAGDSAGVEQPPPYLYRIEERRDATPEARALRAAWMNG